MACVLLVEFFPFALRLVCWDVVVVVLCQRMVLDLVCAVDLEFLRAVVVALAD